MKWEQFHSLGEQTSASSCWRAAWLGQDAKLQWHSWHTTMSGRLGRSCDPGDLLPFPYLFRCHMILLSHITKANPPPWRFGLDDCVFMTVTALGSWSKEQILLVREEESVCPHFTILGSPLRGRGVQPIKWYASSLPDVKRSYEGAGAHIASWRLPLLKTSQQADWGCRVHQAAGELPELGSICILCQYS